MTVNEFLIEELNRRAEAAKVLTDDININDVGICAGCYRDGIKVWNGIEQIAAVTGAGISEHRELDRLIQSVEINGAVFFQETYCKRGDTK